MKKNKKIYLTEEFQKYIDDYREMRKILERMKELEVAIEDKPDHWILTEKGDKNGDEIISKDFFNKPF